MSNLKDIHLGNLIAEKVEEYGVETNRICKFFKIEEIELQKMFEQKDMETNLLLGWSKLLEYDFFRLYSQHLILYSPPKAIHISNNSNSNLPQFRKNLYTQDIIFFILELVEKGVKTKRQIIEEYRIPKTTLYKWIYKYSKNKKKDESA